MRSRLTFFVLALFVAGSVAPGAQVAPVRLSRTQSATHVLPVTGSIVGTAWRADGTPLPDARLRLRNVQTGEIVATTVGDGEGRFAFDAVPQGPYVVELVDEDGRVLALGPLFSVTPAQQAVTYVRLAARAPWFAGFFSNAAAAAIATAATLGVTAVGSNGLPASPQ